MPKWVVLGSRIFYWSWLTQQLVNTISIIFSFELTSSFIKQTLQGHSRNVSFVPSRPVFSSLFHHVIVPQTGNYPLLAFQHLLTQSPPIWPQSPNLNIMKSSSSSLLCPALLKPKEGVPPALSLPQSQVYLHVPFLTSLITKHMILKGYDDFLTDLVLGRHSICECSRIQNCWSVIFSRSPIRYAYSSLTQLLMYLNWLPKGQQAGWPLNSQNTENIRICDES